MNKWVFLLLATLMGLSLGFGMWSEGYLECDDINHFMYSRWSFEHPRYLLDVWGRPLMTLLYAGPAQLGHEAARVLTSLLAGIGAFLAWLTAREYKLKLAPLAILFTFSSPLFFLLSYSFLTEILFSAVLIGAVLLYQRGHYGWSAFVVSLSPAARPEGFFIGVLWGVFFLFDPAVGASLREGKKGIIKRFRYIALLPVGTLIWNFCGFLYDGDLLWLVHNWPWSAESIYGSGDVARFFAVIPVMVTPYFLPFFIWGVVAMFRSKKWLCPVVALYVVCLHTVLWTFGLFGSAGYPRYMVTIVPVLAVCTTYGVSLFYDWLKDRERIARFISPDRVIAFFGVIAVVLLLTVWPFVTKVPKHFDFILIDHVAEWYLSYEEEHPGTKIAAAHPYLYFSADLDSKTQGFYLTEKDLIAAPSGSLVFWETKFAEPFSHITPEMLNRLGFHEIPKSEICDWQEIRKLPRIKGSFDMGLADFNWNIYRKEEGKNSL